MDEEPLTARGVLTLVKALLLFESVLYSAITPLLPHCARALGASKPAIGVLAARYTAGLIPGAVLGSGMAARVGVRRTTLIGLVAFAAARRSPSALPGRCSPSTRCGRARASPAG